MGVPFACPGPALAVARRLRTHGHACYLVGGAVRDFLLDRPWHDADLVSDAPLIDIYRVFSDAQIVGTRMPVVMVGMHGATVEVTSMNGALHHDALQRDFTVNAVYADPFSGASQDPVGGLCDLAQRTLRTIVPARDSFHADPVRILRGIRIAAACGLLVEPQLLALMPACAPGLRRAQPQRVSRECGKMLGQCSAPAWLALLQASGLAGYLLRAPMRAVGFVERPLPRLPGVAPPGRAVTVLVHLLLEAGRSELAEQQCHCPAEAVDQVLARVQGPLDAVVQALAVPLRFWLKQALATSSQHHLLEEKP